MHRNLVVPVSLLLLGLVGCRAQEERKALQNSVTRLEQKLNRLDESMRAQQAAQEAGKDAKATNDQAMAEMKRVLDEARAKAERVEVAAKQRVEEAMAKAKQEDQNRSKALEEARARLADFERRFADARGEMENRARDSERMRSDAERQIQELRRALEQAQRETGELRQQMARQQGERRSEDGRMEAIERLAAERREIEKLRAQVMADIARGQRQDPEPQGGKVEVAQERLQRLTDEMAKLRQENEALKKALAEARQALAGGKQAAAGHFADKRPTQIPPKGAAVPIAPAAATKSMVLPLAGGGSLNIENCEVHIHVQGDTAKLQVTPMTRMRNGGGDETVLEVVPAPQAQQETPPAKAPKAVRARKVDGRDAEPATGGEGKAPAPEPKKAGGGETIDEDLLERVLELLIGPV